jgi:hypothetical protein
MASAEFGEKLKGFNGNRRAPNAIPQQALQEKSRDTSVARLKLHREPNKDIGEAIVSFVGGIGSLHLGNHPKAAIDMRASRIWGECESSSD